MGPVRGRQKESKHSNAERWHNGDGWSLQLEWPFLAFCPDSPCPRHAYAPHVHPTPPPTGVAISPTLLLYWLQAKNDKKARYCNTGSEYSYCSISNLQPHHEPHEEPDLQPHHGPHQEPDRQPDRQPDCQPTKNPTKNSTKNPTKNATKNSQINSPVQEHLRQLGLRQLRELSPRPARKAPGPPMRRWGVGWGACRSGNSSYSSARTRTHAHAHMSAPHRCVQLQRTRARACPHVLTPRLTCCRGRRRCSRNACTY